MDRLEGKVLARADNKKLPRMGLLQEDSQLPAWDMVDYVDTPLLKKLANESRLQSGSVEANFEIRS